MEPYRNHMEHLNDILTLPETPEQMENIIARENVTDVFLPIVHLVNVFRPESTYYFYLAVALSVQGVDALAGKSRYIPLEEASLLRLRIAGLLDASGAFRPRVLNFIMSPDEPVPRPWLTANYISSESYTHVMPTSHARRLSALTSTLLSENMPHIIWVHGRHGSGRKTTVLSACPMPVLFSDMDLIPENTGLTDVVDELVLESRLMGCVLCFLNADTIFKDKRLTGILLNTIRPVARLAFFISESAAPNVDTERFQMTDYHIPLPDKSLAHQIWNTFSDGFGLNFDYQPDFAHLASSYRLTPLQIRQCLEDVRNEAVISQTGVCSAKLLEDSCRKRGVLRLPFLGGAATYSFEWEELILPDDVKSELDAVVARVEHKNTVYEDWGFGVKTPYGQGVTVLLEGPPGTGKTMTAHALAQRLNLPLYKADLSAVMSKYIGETEKNLSTVFSEANCTDCVLFFDEADAIFSKRTDVNNALDRYGNLEVSFLLQKLEEHRGLTILATNLARNFDEAFKRRIQFIVRLPFPDKILRERIWRSMFPQNAPLSDDIDFSYLSERYSLNGSAIKNVVLSAAFRAAALGIEINMNCIMDAIKSETLKTGVAPR